MALTIRQQRVLREMLSTHRVGWSDYPRSQEPEVRTLCAHGLLRRDPGMPSFVTITDAGKKALELFDLAAQGEA